MYVPSTMTTPTGARVLREALGSSYNVVAVRLLGEIGVETQDIARRLEATPLATAERLPGGDARGTEVSLQLTRLRRLGLGPLSPTPSGSPTTG